MAVENNLNFSAGLIEEFVYKSIRSPFANMPPRDIYSANFDDVIAQEGQVIHAHQNTTVYGSLNDLANGWDNTSATASNYSASMHTLGKDHLFNTTNWQTIGEGRILDMFSTLGKNVANGITVNIMNNINTTTYPNYVTVASSSVFSYTGSNGLQAIGTTLDNLEVDQNKKYCIITPNTYQSLVASSNLFQALVYGGTELIRGNGFNDSDGSEINSTHPGIHLVDFDIYKYPRLGTLGLRPFGGDKVSLSTLIGFAGVQEGLFAANRVPMPTDVPLMQSYVYTDPTSRFSLQYIMAFDVSKPGIRFGCYTLFGSAAANPNALVPIITQSN